MKIAICVPHHGDVKPEFAFSLVNLTIATLEAGLAVNGERAKPQLKPFFFGSSIVQVNRIKLAATAIRWGADYILWADSDHTFPPTALLSLLAHNVDVVGVNYPRRGPRFEFTATGMDGKHLQPGSGLESVMSMGMGLCLVKAYVFRRIPRPWFQVTISPKGIITGEDCHFFQLLRDAGFKINVDHDLSAEVGHIGQQIYTAKNVKPPAD